MSELWTSERKVIGRCIGGEREREIWGGFAKVA